jgi:hypothetical protein
MRKIKFLAVFMMIGLMASGQFIYKIKADTLLVTNDSCTAELALENSTKNIKGFLYNYGKGRTKFVSALTRLNDTTWLVGPDTLKLRATSVDAWRLTGNTGTSLSTNFLGNIDNVGLAFRTNNTNRMTISSSGNVGIGTTSPDNLLHIAGTPSGTGIHVAGSNPVLHLDGDEGSYYTAIVLDGILGSGKIDNYGINGLAGIMMSRQTTNGWVGVGASYMGGASITSDSTIVPHRVIGARGQTADLFRVSQNTHNLPGSFFENPVFTINKDGDIWNNRTMLFYSGPATGHNLKLGFDGTNSQAIHISSTGVLAPPLIKMENISFYGTGGVIDLNSNSGYNYDPYGTGIGAGLRFVKTAGNGSALINNGGTWTDHQVHNNSNQEVLYSHYTKTRVGASNGYSYYVDAQTLSGGSGTAYAFYANAGQSYFKDRLTLDGPNGYSQLKLAKTYTPSATGDSNGQTGDVAWDGSYIYIKTASGWKRAALSTF